MPKPTDDLEAVRILIDTLESFTPDDRDRIIRWAREKLGMPSAPEGHTSSRLPSPGLSFDGPARGVKDIKTFLTEKSPHSDRQLAAAVAYFYAFEASGADRKDSIGSQDLIEACRRAGRRRPTNAGQTLRNAAHAGYLDKAAASGHYKLNAVGENLVAMVLPAGSEAPPPARAAKTKRPKR